MRKRRNVSIAIKYLCLLLVLCFFCVPLYSCDYAGTYKLKYYDELDEERGYNENLFYYNDMPAACADPTCIYIDDETDTENYGWFFMYPTSSLYGGRGNVCYRSRDMKSWEYVCPIFEPNEESWINERMWAPEVIYDKTTKKYYLFGSAANNSTTHNKYRVIFYDHEQKEYWNSVAAETENLIAGKTQREAISILQDLIAEAKSFLENVTPNEEQENGRIYTEERIVAALQDIQDLNMELVWADSEQTQLSDVESDVNHNYETLLFAAICAQAADVLAMKHEFSYALYVAVSDSPRGPFVQYTNVPEEEGYDPNKRTLGIDDPFISPEDVYPWLLNYKSEFWQDLKNGTAKDMADAEASGGQLLESETNAMELIDVHPYLDPVTGKKYLYAAAYTDGGSFILGVEAGETWTDEPKWETLTRLTRNGYYTASDLADSNKSTDLNERYVNEGPFLYYKNGTYYLTLSVNHYTSKYYAVVQAVSDSPLGPFRKLSLEEGGKVIGSELHWDHMGGPGHHSLCEYGDELYIIYHSHYDRSGGYGTRGSCFDPIVWTKNDNGQEIMHCNGPSYSLQPKCGPDMEYKNIADEAEIKVRSLFNSSDTGLLTDGVIRFFSWDEFIKEFECTKKITTTITLTFEEYRTVRALMIYNSYDYAKHFRSIDKIEFDALANVDGTEKKITALIEDLKFDVERYINEEVEDEEFMRPGGAAIAEFDELKVKEIRITLKPETTVAISEIYVLGL